MPVIVSVSKQFNYIDLSVYESYSDEYGYDHERCIFATHGHSKEKVLGYVDEWENNIKKYAQELREKINALEE